MSIRLAFTVFSPFSAALLEAQVNHAGKLPSTILANQP
jgi:hypothetical protein